ncbi:MAG: thiamine phosphate synthase [Fervidicoccaceae archaeon]
MVRSVKARVGYKRIGVEVGSLEEAIEAIEAGADYVDFDHVNRENLKAWVEMLKSNYSWVSIAAAGGIDLENVAEYASTGVDIITTSAPYRAKLLSFTTIMEKSC